MRGIEEQSGQYRKLEGGINDSTQHCSPNIRPAVDPSDDIFYRSPIIDQELLQEISQPGFARRQQKMLYPNRLSSLDGDLYKNARSAFIMKVYIVLSIQLFFTSMVCFLAYNIKPFLEFQQTNWWLLYVLSFLLIVAVVCVFCCRKHPYDIISLAVFTIGQSYLVSFICSFEMTQDEEGASTVIQACILTLAVVIGLTIYSLMVTWTSKEYNITFAILVVIGFSSMTMVIVSLISEQPFLITLYCTLGALVAGIYIVVDTQLILGRNDAYKLELDEYVLGSFILYLDIIRLFLYLLTLLKKFKKN